ncbi:hypothetical protein Egran_06565 [Elaphomyces granulatus]|uniref:DUF7598 domain-containing protein n=1 Tax=Elaphomyces granulatus TaxID=519963 RepID=A0A232LND5_9EURO|nr:hypothetical protein Egran_06565 [Elaphomyces granulatus]
MGLSRSSLAGPGYVILNIIRVLNIIVFLDTIAASVALIVKINIVNGFFFFEAVFHVIIVGISIFLIVSELPILRGYFDRNWPLFGQDSSFITLSIVMMIMGIAVLGDLNKSTASDTALGLAFWRIVVSAGILAIIMSTVNVLASFIFRDNDGGVTARHVRAYGAVAPSKVLERSSSHKSFQLGLNRQDSLPTYRTHSPISRPLSVRNGTRFPLKISPRTNDSEHHGSVPKSPKETDITVPNLAHHPAMYSTTV